MHDICLFYSYRKVQHIANMSAALWDIKRMGNASDGKHLIDCV